MTVLRGQLFKRLADEEMVIPYLEQALFADNWPEHYDIRVDLRQHTGPPPGEIGWFYPSVHCLMDSRRLYYEIHPGHRENLLKEEFPMSAIMSMTMGSAAHAIAQTQLMMAGKISGDQDVEVRFKNEERRCRGRLDWLMTRPDGSRYPVEMKTQNSRAYRETKSVLPSWECQLQVTMDGLGYDEGVIFLLEMGYPWGMREFRVRRDEDILKAIYDKWAMVLDHVVANTPPSHCCERGSPKMDKCRARSVCWLAEPQER